MFCQMPLRKQWSLQSCLVKQLVKVPPASGRSVGRGKSLRIKVRKRSLGGLAASACTLPAQALQAHGHCGSHSAHMSGSTFTSAHECLKGCVDRDLAKFPQVPVRHVLSLGIAPTILLKHNGEDLSPHQEQACNGCPLSGNGDSL